MILLSAPFSVRRLHSVSIVMLSFLQGICREDAICVVCVLGMPLAFCVLGMPLALCL